MIMKRRIYLIISLMLLLNALACPISPEETMSALTAALILPLLGLTAARLLPQRPQEVHAYLYSFGDSLLLALPVLLAVNPFAPALAEAAAFAFLLHRVAGGWLLRRAGLRREKNFTLILAYRQTLAHCHRFPEEIHPTKNPLFQPARNAQDALFELIPPAALLLAWLLRLCGISLQGLPAAGAVIRIFAVTVLLLQMTKIRKPMSQARSLVCAPGVCAVIVRLVAAALLLLLHTDVPELALLLCAPVSALAPIDLQGCGTDEALLRSADSSVVLSRAVWIIFALIILIMK